ncbi:hypothetical protein SASPL_148483 [Salvia splendens]|uniref:Uncharacterized protein n=1 Tax=Salvia splendens TaxID=180675 RepID=A0A8X8WA83_SALSN|nr:hypothetical protein SASPL_148483 [Salvia splendens]
MNDVTNLIQDFEAMKIAGSTACNMIGVIPEEEVDEEETVASLKTALAKDKFNVLELVEAVQSMFKVTAQLTELAEEGIPFDIHPSFVSKNISSFTAIGRVQSSDTKKSVISVGTGAARLCASKSEYQDRNPIIGTSFNGGSSASHQTGLEKEGSINVEEIVKSVMVDYMEGGGDDAADEFYSEASGTKSITILDNKLRSNDETNICDKELDVEAIVKSAVEAYMECDELYTVVESNGKVDDADILDEFASNIDKEVSEIPHFKWGDIDMMLVKMEKTMTCDSPTAVFQRHWYG